MQINTITKITISHDELKELVRKHLKEQRHISQDDTISICANIVSNFCDGKHSDILDSILVTTEEKYDSPL